MGVRGRRCIDFGHQCLVLMLHVFFLYFMFRLSNIPITFNSETFNFTPSKIQIVAGTNEWKTGIHYNVSKIIINEKFVLSDYINDIALIRARTPIEFNERVQPINFTSKAVQPDTLLQTTGWGTLKVGIFLFPHKFASLRSIYWF